MWSTVSNASLKSKNTDIIKLPESMLSYINCMWFSIMLAQYIIMFKVEIVLILPGLFLRERIIYSTSAEDTGAKNNELAQFPLRS